MNCTQDFTFQCMGSGIVDCTGTCPGDKDTLNIMLEMLQNETLGEKFPMIAEIQNKSKSGDGSNEKFNEMLRGCKFDGILALMGKLIIYIVCFLKKVLDKRG